MYEELVPHAYLYVDYTGPIPQVTEMVMDMHRRDCILFPTTFAYHANGIRIPA